MELILSLVSVLRDTVAITAIPVSYDVTAFVFVQKPSYSNIIDKIYINS